MILLSDEPIHGPRSRWLGELADLNARLSAQSRCASGAAPVGNWRLSLHLDAVVSAMAAADACKEQQAPERELDALLLEDAQRQACGLTDRVASNGA